MLTIKPNVNTASSKQKKSRTKQKHTMSTIINRSNLIHQVQFDINTHLSQKDLIDLIAFLECEPSIGGKIQTHDLLQNKSQSSLIVMYESPEIASLVLTRKFIRYKFLYLRTSRNGYKLDTYDLNANRLIIQCSDKVRLSAIYLFRL